MRKSQRDGGDAPFGGEFADIVLLEEDIQSYRNSLRKTEVTHACRAEKEWGG